jgi:hypothetical protein
MAVYYSSSASTSSISKNKDTGDETYDTINIYVNSQKGSQPLAGYSNINSGFTVKLANPIILDINHRYVMALIKGGFDISHYTDIYHSFDIQTDIVEYQYENNQKNQVLYQVYGCKYEPTGTSGNVENALFDVANVVYKFINPTQKIISQISFWITEAFTGEPLITPEPPTFSYGSEFSILIKKVNTKVIAVSAL